MTLEIFNRQRTQKINLCLLRQIANALLVELNIEKAELGISLVSAKEMAAANRKFLQHEGSTDVITFSYADNVEHASSLSRSQIQNSIDRLEACPTLRGEIFICVDEAIWQAKKFKTTWQSEIVRYLVHGVLHLLGHDDRNAAARRRMKREEDQRLAVLSKKFSLAQIGGASKLRA